MEAIMTEAAPATPAEILEAAKMLAGVCDGARTRDDSGYNAVDGPTARSILRTPNPTARQIRCLWNMLRKYRGQLEGFGVDYDRLVPPEMPPRAQNGTFTLPSNRVRLVWVDTAYGRQIAVVFAYDGGIVNAVKGPQGTKRWFDKDGSKSGHKNAWVIPGGLDEIEDLLGRLEELSPPVQVDPAPGMGEFLESERARRKTNLVESRAESANINVPTKLPLRPFQLAGVKWIDDHDGAALVGDSPGLGKTCQALGWLTLHPEALPALVVVPSTLRLNWRGEVEKFTELKTLIMTAKSSLKSFRDLGIDASETPLPGYDITVANYDLFRAPEDEDAEKRDITKPKKKATWTGFVNGLPLSEFGHFKTVIFDEIHRLKDPKSQRSRCARELSKKMRYRVGLTGTPIPNRPIEIYHPVSIIRPGALPDYISFGKKFCAGFQDRFGWNLSGASNLGELNELLRAKSGMIRRTKEQVLTELPPKTRVTIPIMLEGKLKDYEKAAKPILEKLAKNKVERDEWRTKMASMDEAGRKKYQADHAEEAARKNKLTGYMIDEIEKVKQAALNAKFDEAMKFILDLAESTEKLLVFTSHHETTDRVLEKLTEEKLKADVIDGRTPQAKRDGIKTMFQEGDTKVLVCGIRAAGEGLTLTASHTVVKLEFDWNFSVHLQCEDRVHRFSQTKAVTIYYLMALGTIEQKIVGLIDSKSEIGYAALGEGDRMLDERGIMDSVLDDLLGAPV